MNIRSLSDEILLQNIQDLAREEREITLKVLHHLREVERRSLYAKLSYSSLFEYAVKELKYSEGAAQRRISSMRLLKELPEIESKIESGALSLMALSQAQVFFRQEATSKEQKKEILLNLENKTKREVEKELISRSSAPENFVPEKIRVVSDNFTEIKFLVDAEFLKELEELKNLAAHRAEGQSIKDLLAFALKQSLQQLRPKAPKEKLPEKKLPPPVAVKTAKHSRYIAADVKRQVWHRDRGQCTYQQGGRRCCSKHALEFDHVKPFSLGGENTTENLRLRCKTHNQLAALHVFGEKKMERFVPRLR